MDQRFFICKKCGNMMARVKETEVHVSCCGELMKELIPNTVDAAGEKHIPVYKVEGNKVHVSVGEVEHPMQDEHSIEWISIQTKSGNQRKSLKSKEKPQADFIMVDGDEVEAVYAYCNLHGLWKA